MNGGAASRYGPASIATDARRAGTLPAKWRVPTTLPRATAAGRSLPQRW